MQVIDKTWKANPSSQDVKKIKLFKKHFGITEITSRILIDRGIDTIKEAETFFRVKYEDLYDPFLLEDMFEAVARILKAKNEQIVIFGDYDVDGITSTAILTKVLRYKGFTRVDSVVSLRSDGYGIKAKHIEQMYKEKVSLIITVDLGTTCFDALDRAKELGIDVIVVDHHLLKKDNIGACAFVNPQRGSYPFKGLSAAGVTFKLLQAIERIDGPLFLQEYLQYVALATIADVVPLVNENRIFAKLGLEQLSKTNQEGLKAFLVANSLYGRKITSDIVAYILAPRINAAGRLVDAQRVLEMLLIDKHEDYPRAIEIAKNLNVLNNQRKKIEHQTREEALQIIKKQHLEKNKVLVLAHKKWNRGVVGIVASVISDMFHRPCILIAVDGKKAHGSVRNIAPFPLIDSLNKCSSVLSGFGGHAMAAGLSLDTKNILLFRKEINRVANRVLKKEDLIHTSYYDAKINFEDLNDQLSEELSRLEPFGEGNRFPVFLVEDVTIPRADVAGDGEHLRVTIVKNKSMISGMGFWMAHHKESITSSTQKFDILFEFDKNIYDGQEFLQINLKDLKLVELKW